MKLMTKYLTAFIVFYLLYSCSMPKNESPEHVYKVNVAEAQEEKFSSAFDNITYIPLETIEGNEIGQISRILHHNGKYVIADRLTNTVLIFREDGKYSSKIEAIGNGPGEYVQITDLAIDKFCNLIKVFDAMQGKVLSYDWEGRFTYETKLPVFPPPLHFVQIDQLNYAFDFQRCSTEKEWQYNLSINPEDFSGKVSKFLPYDKPLDVSFSPRITLLDVGNETIYIPLYSSTIYTIDSLTIQPRYTFDFGDKWVSKDFINTQWKDALKFMNKLSSMDFVYYFNLLESASHIYAEFMYKENKYHLVIDKGTNHLLLQRETEAYKCHYTEMPMCCIDNKFVIPLTPLEYESMAGEEAVQMQEGDNPVLMLVTFKNF